MEKDVPKKKPSGKKRIPLTIVAIGASAGGLEAIQDFLGHLPVLKNACLIVAQHLSPTHKSMLVQLLSRETKLVVAEAVNNSALEINKIYITPPDKEISVIDGRMILKKPQSNVGPKPSVDVLFQSLAEESGIKAIGVILSGTGSDGALGVRALKKAGGFIIAQEPHTAKYDGMPLAAIETGEVDLVLPPDKMGEEIQAYILNPQQIRVQQPKNDANATSLEKIISLLSKRTGTDFSNYKSATIIRRLEKRLSILKIKSIDEYLDLIEKNPKEQEEMFNMILIGVTTFFRDMESFGVLENYLHKIINAKTNKDPIRIWVPGCSTGEEAYSIAILFNRILKDRTQNYNIQIFATDIDERAISTARKGIYMHASIQDLPQELIDQYFTKKEDSYELIKAIRSMVLFSKHDLTNNPPFLKLDLISCRNLMIYFNAALQQQIIPIFHYALLPDGYLFLGKSETVGQFSDLFATVDGRNKFFQRKRGGNLHAIKFSAFRAQKQKIPQVTAAKVRKELSISDLVKETIFNTYEHPYVIINSEYDIQEISGDVRLFLSLQEGSIQVNLLKMVNKELQIEVRSIVAKAIKGREAVKSSIKKFILFGNEYFVRITAKPLIYTEATDELFIVVFEKLDLEEFIQKGIISNEEEVIDIRAKELEHELATTKEHLQTYIEELETSNEEMQSLNEEMQSTNEELQSTNEELETSNEELQSTNEEIQIAYSELKALNAEMERKEQLLKEKEANNNALLNNNLQAFVLIDNAYKVVAFNEQARNTFNDLRRRKIKKGDSFIDFIAPEQLELFIRDFSKVSKGEIVNREIQIKNAADNTRWFSLSYTPVSVSNDSVNGISMGILDITDLRETLFDLNTKERLLSAVFDSTNTGITVTDEKGILLDVNEAYCSVYGYAKDEIIGQSFTTMIPIDYRDKAQSQHDEFIINGHEMPYEWEVVKKDGHLIYISVSARLIELPDGKRLKVTSIHDITTEKLIDNAIKLSEQKYKASIETSINAILLTKPDGTILEANEAACDLFGYELEELREIGRSAIINQTDLRWEALIKERTDKGKTKGELWGIKKNGERFDIEFASSLYTDNNGEIFGFSVISDISARKKNERNIELLLNNTDEAFIISDVNMRITAFNSVFQTLYSEFFNKTVKEGDNILDFAAAPDGQQDFVKLFKNVLKGNREERILSYTHKSGSISDLELVYKPLTDNEGKISGIIISVVDVTEKRFNEARLKSITGNMPAVLFRYKLNPDSSDQLLYVTEKAKVIWGIDAEDAMRDNKLVWDLYHKDDIDHHWASIYESGEKLTKWDSEWRINHPDGSIKWHRGIGTPQKMTDGSVIWDSVIIDITEVKLKELEINRVKSNQEALINATTDPMWSIDKNLKIAAMNSAYKGSIKRLVNKDLAIGDSVIMPDFGDEYNNKWIEYYNRGLAGDTFNINEEILNPATGEIEYYRLSFNPICDQTIDVIGVAVYAKNISKETESIKEIENVRDQLVQIMDMSLDMICTIDEQGRFMAMSDACRPILGYTPEELVGKLYMDLVLPEDIQKTKAAAAAITEGKMTTNFRNRYMRKDGSIVHLTWSARWFEPTKTMYCISRDGTEAIISEQALLESEQRYKDLFENNPSPMLIWNFETLEIVECNEEALMKYGYTRDEFIGLSILDIRPEEEKEFMRRAAVSEEVYGSIHKSVWTHKKKNGELMKMDITGHILTYKGRRATLVILHDITDQIKAENQLKESEEKYKILFYNSPLPKWLYDLETQKIMDVNDTAILKYGYSREEFLTMKINDLLTAQSRSSLTDMPTRMKNSNGVSFFGVVDHQKKDGSLIQVELSGDLLSLKGNDSGIIVANDVTEKENALKLLSISNKRYEYVTQATSDAIWDWDIDNNKVYWGESHQQIFGNIKERHLNDIERVHSRIPKEEIDNLLISANEALSGSKTNWKYEHSYLKSDGIYAFVSNKAVIVRNDEGRAIRVIGAMQDITKRKEEEHRLKLLESVVTNTNDAVLITEAEPFDLPGPRIIYANEAFTRMTGYTSEEVIGQTPRILQGPLSDKQELKRLRTAMEKWEPCEITTVNYRKNGEEFWINFSLSPVADEKGWFTHWISVERDVTQQKLYEQNLTKSNDLLRRKTIELSVMNKELEQFAYIASHDLQEPLRMVTSFMTKISEKYEDKLDEKGKKYISLAVDGAMRMRNIILDLLEYSRSGKVSLDIAEINIPELIFDIEKILGKLIDEKQATISFAHLPVIHASKTLISQLFRNLIGNALKYSKEGIPAEIRIHATENETHWIFTISDNGIGINPEFFIKIFGLFQRLHEKSEYSGTGIGLAICTKIVERHEGEIWVESEEGVGTAFSFTISKKLNSNVGDDKNRVIFQPV